MRQPNSPVLGGVMEVVDRFFFSSRRRHTRFDCDWSSDVCSSDLDGMGFSFRRKIRRLLRKAFASSSAARRYVRRWLRTAESFTRIALLSIDSPRSEEHTSELQSQSNLVCRLLLEKKKNIQCNDIS